MRLRDLFKTPTTLRILDVLLEDPGMKPHTLSSLAKAAGASRLSTRGALKHLEPLGLISVDRRFLPYRMRLISLRTDTPLGVALLDFYKRLCASHSNSNET